MSIYLDEAAWEEQTCAQEERIANDPQARADYEAWCAWARQRKAEADAEEDRMVDEAKMGMEVGE